MDNLDDGGDDRAVPAPLLRPFEATSRCSVCGKVASTVQLIPVAGVGATPTQWRFLYRSVAAGSGSGRVVDFVEAARYAAAFAAPLTYERIHTAGLEDDAGWCGVCRVPYCYEHWHVGVVGYGRCPARHGKSLDPLWTPC